MSLQDQEGEGMIGPTPYRYQIKIQPTAEGVRIHMTGHGDNLTELGKELMEYYPLYLNNLKEKGMKIAPMEKPPKVVKST